MTDAPPPNRNAEADWTVWLVFATLRLIRTAQECDESCEAAIRDLRSGRIRL